MEVIIQNGFYAPELKKYIRSTNTHDFTGVVFPDGKEYFVDGGPSYFRASGDFELRENGRVVLMHLTSNSSEKEIINQLMWGSRGKNGDQPMEHKPIRYLEKDHIEAILQLDYIGCLVRDVCTYWLNTHEVEVKETHQPQIDELKS